MKNVIFDLGSVILKHKAISVLDKFDIDNNTYNELKVFFDDWKELDLGNKTVEDKYNSCNFSNNKYKDILINYCKYRDINMDLINIINKLKLNNYNVYVLSDNNFTASNYYMHHELFKNIDGWVFSCDYHTLKKDGKLFDIILEKYHLNPNECYFIDDREENIIIAKTYGIKGFIFKEEDDINNLISDMKKSGINI